MKRYLPHIAIAIVTFFVGFFAGGISSSSKSISLSNSGSLVWLSGISKMISDGKSEQAQSILNTAIDAHISVIQRASEHPFDCLIYVIPWQRDALSSMQEKSLQEIKKALISSNAALSPSSKAYLSTIPN